jgi:hypothetical protein
MQNLEEIENRIKSLSREEFQKLRDWILERDWEAWDAQIERDAKSGKLETISPRESSGRSMRIFPRKFVLPRTGASPF